MPREKSKSNVVQLKPGQPPELTKSQLKKLAEDKVYEAWQNSGTKRARLAKEALAAWEHCAEAYLVLAADERDPGKKIALYRKAIEVGSKALGKNWKTKYEGICWLDHDTRPVMRAMASLAIQLQWEDELEEALSIFQELLELNPNDNQGVRYEFAGCLYEAGEYDKLKKLLDAYKTDPCAALLYTKALLLFRQTGPSKEANTALLKAFKANPYVPIFLSEVVEMPDESPASIGIGDESEAIAYALENNYRWWDTKGSCKWLAKTLGLELDKIIDDKELLNDVIAELNWDDEDDDD